jgi:chromosome segregation protein
LPNAAARLSDRSPTPVSARKKPKRRSANLEVKLQEAIADRNAAGQESVEAEKALYRTGEDLKNARRHAEITELEQEQLMGEESDLEDQMDEYNQALGRITAQVEQAQAETTEATRRIGGLSDRLEHHNQQIVDLKLQLTAHNTKLDNGRQTLERLKEFERDSHVRLEQLQQEINTKNHKQASARELVSAKEKTLQQTYRDLNHLDTDLEANLSEYRTIDANLQENDGQMEVFKRSAKKPLRRSACWSSIFLKSASCATTLPAELRNATTSPSRICACKKPRKANPSRCPSRR